jgi:hypothetical protein
MAQMPFDNIGQSLARIATPFNDLRLRLDARVADRRQANAFRRAGRELANSQASADDDRLLPFFNALSRHHARLDLLAMELAKSHANERVECDAVTPWLRPLVLLRGLGDRALLHQQMRRCRREMGVCHEALGRAAGTTSRDGAALGSTPVRDGDGSPEWTSVLAREGREFGIALWQQLRGKLLPRASALAGLAAGWWVASTYTDSHLRSIMNTVGIGKGGTHVVSGSTYKAMSFWLPILAAAICAYLGDRVARAIKHRHKDAV